MASLFPTDGPTPRQAKRRPRGQAVPARTLVCRGCGAEWEHTAGTVKARCPYCGKAKDARPRQEYARRYDASQARLRQLVRLSADPQRRREIARRSALVLRRRVFFKIVGHHRYACARCGCDDFRLLEINHRNGGGGQEMKGRRRKKLQDFYQAIVQGTRSTDDLELLCRPCNAIHALELKYGPLPMRVIWKPQTGGAT